jgi:acetyl/propionyl-CoA carboxylase alpha subunit
MIANRGEISQRVVRTCNAMGIDTVAIYSTADAQAPFVSEATERYCVGPAASKDSYLNVDNVLQAIHETGAQAVHPGM